jgi:putative chitinase
MIGEDTVLTAAHCIHSGTTVGHSYGNFRVAPSNQGGSAPFGRCRAQEAFVLTGWTASATADQSRNYDLGALKLDCKIGNATGWLGVRAIGDKEIGLRTMVEGYTADLSQLAQRWVSEDYIRVIQDFKGFYQNDSSGGTNGAQS